VQEDHVPYAIFLHGLPPEALSAGRSTAVRDLPAPTAQYGNIRRKIDHYAMNTRAYLVGDHRNRTTNAMSACAKSPPAATRA